MLVNQEEPKTDNITTPVSLSPFQKNARTRSSDCSNLSFVQIFAQKVISINVYYPAKQYILLSFDIPYSIYSALTIAFLFARRPKFQSE